MSAVTPANRGSPEPMGNPFATAEGAPDPVGFLFARSLIEAAVRMAFVTAGRDFGHARYEPRERPGGNYALFIDNAYEVTLETKDFDLAERKALLRMLADAADAIGVVDVRMALADRAMEYVQPIKDAVSKETGEKCKWALKAIAPYASGKRFHELDETWAQATIKGLRKKYGASSIHQIFTYFRSGLSAYCKKLGSPPLILHRCPPDPMRSDRIIFGHEFAMIERYCDGTEFYDPKTKTWSDTNTSGQKASVQNRHNRKMGGRLFRLAMATGSRGGRLIRLAWGPSRHHPYVDIENGCLYRIPLGARAKKNKKAPWVKLPPGMVDLLRRWREEDGPRAKFVIHTRERRPYSGDAGELFRRITRALNIQDLPFHRTRHTVITTLVRAGVPLPVISAQCGISIRVLEECYDHTPGHVLQPIAHPVLDAILAGDIPTDIEDIDDGWCEDEDWEYEAS